MNKLENGVQATAVVADAAIPKPGGPATNSVLGYSGTSWLAALLVNANIDAAAAIAYSKLNLAGGIVNNDVSASAGIVGSKLATGLTGPPGTKLTHDEITANVNVTATTEATANTIITASAFTFDGATPVMIEFYCSVLNKGTTSVSLWLYDNGASIGQIAFNSAGSFPCLVRRRLTPSNAAHTYSIRGTVDAGTGSVGAGAGGLGVSEPAYIRIVKE